MERIILFSQPESSISEAYRVLCANVLSSLEEKKLIEIAGVKRHENASEITANLAVAVAQTGKRILLIDCDLHNPKQHELFGLQNYGLADCLATEVDYNSFIQTCSQENLFVLCAGEHSDQPVAMLLNVTLQKILIATREMYDLVLLDVPAVNSCSTAVVLGTKTDGVLLIVTNREDKVEEVQKAKDFLLQAGASVLGCVLDKA